VTITAQELIALLGLTPHPEGGHFVEVFRASASVSSLAHDGPRSASTAIYFLLENGELSHLHRVRSDELWHHYAGDSVQIDCIDARGHSVAILGSNFAVGERPLAVVPADTYQAARSLPGSHGYSLCGCTVAPGFEFSDFELPSAAELLQRLPHHANLIHRLARH
jgi:predicted cupin superfamily sugar epimerase